VNIADRINAAYRAQLLSESAQRGAWWPRASGYGGCLREHAHLLAGFEPRPTSPESERVFELGHQRGARLAQVARTIWPDAVCELEVEIPIPGHERPMHGHLDLWIPSERLIVDFKTAGGFKMGLLVTGAEAAGEDYEMQVQAYRHGIVSRVAQLCVGPNDDLHELHHIKCLLIFEAKDSDARKGVTAGQLVEVEVPHTEELEARFQARMKAIGEMLTAHNSGTLDPKAIPGMPDPSKHWRCKVKDGRPLYCSIGPKVGQCG
jgi:hypothetical protein